MSEVKMDFAEQRETILKLMLMCGADVIEINFDGSGDEGSMEFIVVTSIAPVARIKLSPDDTKIVTTFGYEVLEHTGVNWYDNDGGYGRIVITLANRTVKVDMNVRTMESRYSSYQY